VAGELQSLPDETRRHGREPKPEQRGGPERATARDEAGARGAQELPGRADTARHQPPGEPQGVLEAITSTTEQANQMLLTSLQRLEDSGNRQNEASRKAILFGYKAFEESV